MTEQERTELNKTLPKLMLVRDHSDQRFRKRIVLYILPGNPTYPLIVVSEQDEEKFERGENYFTSTYKYYKELPVVEEMTLEQICKELGKEIKIIK
jgi:hypothetical protein